MSKSESRAKLASAAVAQVRKSIEHFTLSELSENLKKAGCPYSSNVTTELVNKGIIVKKGKDYVFVGHEPIHFSKFIQCLDDARDSQRKYSEKYFLSKTSTPVSTSFTEEDMIRALKAKGYRVLKPVTNFEEC